MKTPKYQQRGSLEFNMTPMIDVTFQLIIFFLVSSHLAQQETQVDLNLPNAASGHDTKEDETRRMTVNLTADGGLLVAGAAVDDAELRRQLAAERNRSEPLEVRIRCDREAHYGRVKPILRACLDYDIRRVTFAVVKADN